MIKAHPINIPLAASIGWASSLKIEKLYPHSKSDRENFTDFYQLALNRE
jgi:hypothetical protein